MSFIELLFLDEFSPTVCQKCSMYLRNKSAGTIISATVPVILFFSALYLFEIDLLYSLSLLLLIPILRISLAEPLKYKK
jgi:hypothetical protein